MIVMIFLNNIKPKGVVKGFYYTHTFLTLMQRNKHVKTYGYVTHSMALSSAVFFLL